MTVFMTKGLNGTIHFAQVELLKCPPFPEFFFPNQTVKLSVLVLVR